MNTTKSGLKLVHKGLFLVSIPLVFGVVLILIFESLLQTSTHLRSNSVRALTVAKQINKLIPPFVDLEAYLHNQQPSASISTPSASLAAIQNIMDETVELAAKQANGDNSAMDDVSALRNQWINSKQLLLSRSTPDQCLQSVRSMQDTLNKLSQKELAVCTHNNTEDKELDKLAQKLMAWSVGLNMIVCPLMALYVAQSLSRRLGVLIENSNRIAAGRPLNPSLEGGDEISQLDKVFREMASKLQLAEQARTDFFTMISHDLRTPLNSIQATLSLISEGVYGPLTKEGVQRVKAAEDASEQLIGMVSQLLDLEKIKSGKFDLEFRPVRLRQILDDAQSAVSGFAEFKNIKMQVGDTTACVLGDQKRLTQVVINLLSNAIKFAPEDSTVAVSVRETDSQQIEVRVSDSGRGVAPEAQAIIFDRFKQASRSDAGAGTGLGLAICKEIVEEHYGTIGVESANGKGSTFWFKLKKLDESATAATSR